MECGTVLNIQKFCINDGPGIRTTVFLKGCPLNCIWCHNPESKSPYVEISYIAEKCISCGKCVKLCRFGCHIIENGIHIFNRDKCIQCCNCLNPFCKALSSVGCEMTVYDVINEVMKDKMFYDTSGGGITLSGGEPMFQFDYSLNILKKAKENGLHTCIETCGFADKDKYKEIAPYVDIFLYDYKETDLDLHKQYTGVSNELILENLYFIDKLNAKTILRCPIIPSFNDRNEHFNGIAKTANSLKNILEVNIEPYHPLGLSKCLHLGKEYPLKDIGFVEDKVVNTWISEIQMKTNVSVVRA